MIRGCFRHVPGIGPRTELVLNESGIVNWDDCIAKQDLIPFNGIRRKKLIDNIRKSIGFLESGDIGFFTASFPTSEQWRILAEYLHSATFIDVETTGLSWNYCHASVISAFHRGNVHSFVHGENLDDFLSLADESELLVTFNGNCFDIPFIERTFNILSLGCPHVDLRWIAWHRGYRGGLKSIEKQLDIRRPPQIEGIDGFEAVDLYYRWQQGDLSSRELLIRYCEADVLATYLVAERILESIGCEIRLTPPESAFRLIGY
ncbi:MAG TPA: ribonuclease H-like domain-containing protein [Spirochaetota bacterium]|nr:ribonuclease H-like domain-containing protein [Spirochaetota bacterium]HQF07614.1 ribonuclease H-like domain-containing protein [Spirochaetota bacterium]HQH96345.1 ribonuclease H-like domain-containing protein [Spirochaetota bacterium]HQJ69519.1 ribonuclease H-like domain-containing protein [Spirochaetota bacterium]